LIFLAGFCITIRFLVVLPDSYRMTQQALIAATCLPVHLKPTYIITGIGKTMALPGMHTLNG